MATYAPSGRSGVGRAAYRVCGPPGGLASDGDGRGQVEIKDGDAGQRDDALGRPGPGPVSLDRAHVGT